MSDADSKGPGGREIKHLLGGLEAPPKPAPVVSLAGIALLAEILLVLLVAAI